MLAMTKGRVERSITLRNALLGVDTQHPRKNFDRSCPARPLRVGDCMARKPGKQAVKRGIVRFLARSHELSAKHPNRPQAAVEAPLQFRRCDLSSFRGAFWRLAQRRIPGRPETFRPWALAQTIGRLARHLHPPRGHGDAAGFGQMSDEVGLPLRCPSVAAISPRNGIEGRNGRGAKRRRRTFHPPV